MQCRTMSPPADLREGGNAARSQAVPAVRTGLTAA
jgi:hypothetical protein